MELEGLPLNWEEKFLDWKERQLILREKYRETPAGFQSEAEREAAWAKLQREREEYQERNRHEFEGSYHPSEEIFVGRETYLEEIHRRFETGKTPVILYGIGGIGKTSIARAYIRTHQEEYDTVLFLTCGADPESLICDDTRLKISNLRYSADKYGDRKQYYKEKLRIFTELAENTRLLLVLDDCNLAGSARLRQVLLLPCDILVTTRVHPELWGMADAGLRVLELQSQEEWKRFFRAWQTREFSPAELKDILNYRERVQGHTLLMVMRLHGDSAEPVPPSGTGQKASEPKRDTAAEVQKPQHDAALEMSQPAWKQIYFQDLFARFSLTHGEIQMLRELSLMPAQGIPESFYLEISGAGERTIERLAGYLLVRREERDGRRMLSLHPLIAEAAGKQFVPTPENCKKLIEGMCRFLQSTDIWNRSYEQNQAQEPYVFALVRTFPKPEGWQVRQFGQLASYLWIQGHFREAERCMLTLVEEAGKYYGKDHQIVGEMYLLLAAVYRNELDEARANPCYWHAYNILTRCRPADHWYYLQRMTAAKKVGRLCYENGRYRNALRFLDEASSFCLAMKTRDTGVQAQKNEGHYYYLQLERAQVLFRMGKSDEAEKLTEQGRDFFEAWDREHGGGYRASEFEELLVKIAMAKGDYEKAERISRKNLERIRIQRGEDYKETLYCRETLADCYAALGKYGQARKEYERVLLMLLREYPHQKAWIQKLRGKCEGEVR